MAQIINYGLSKVPDSNYFAANLATSAVTTTTYTKSSFNQLGGDLLGIGGSLIAVDPGGTTADVPAGDVILHGLAWDATANGFIEKDDTITFAANATDPVSSSIPFLQLRSITFPIQDGAAATYDVGIPNAIDCRIPIKGSNLALASFRVLSDAEPDAANPFIITLDSAKGAIFDLNLLSLDMDTLNVASYANDFSQPQFLVPGDSLRITHANAGANIIGMQVILIGF